MRFHTTIATLTVNSQFQGVLNEYMLRVFAASNVDSTALTISQIHMYILLAPTSTLAHDRL